MPLQKKSYNFESLGTVKSPQKVRKLNFGPLYLLFNKTNSYCILYFFIIHLSPLPRGIACKDRAFMEGAAHGKSVGCVPISFAKMENGWYLALLSVA